MTRPTLVPFKAEHMLAFVDRNGPILEEMRLASRKEHDGPAFTALFNNKIIGCAGVMVMWPGVGYAWVSLDKSIESHKVWMTRTIKAFVRDIVRGLNLHRVEAIAYLDNGQDLRWLETIGFRQEGRYASKYTQDRRDIVRFELIP